MSIEEFLKQFKDVIPWEFELKVGGSRSNVIVNDKEFISYDNWKGKVCPFYNKSLLEPTKKYVPLEELDLQIKVIIKCPYPYVLYWYDKSESTKRKNTDFRAKITSEDGTKDLGYLSLDLTPAGDIKTKYCVFYNEDKTHEVTHQVLSKFNLKTKKTTSSEFLRFVYHNLEDGLEERLVLKKETGVLRTVTYIKRDLAIAERTCSIDSIKVIDNAQEFYSRYCADGPIEEIKYFVGDSTNYIIDKDFTDRLADIMILRSKLEREGDTRSPYRHYDYDEIRKEIAYLEDPKNYFFTGFRGEYIGNTVVKVDSKVMVIFETLEDDYHYFTGVDITGTHAFAVDYEYDRYDKDSYLQAVKNANKEPMFRVKIIDGEEVLFPLGEEITDEEKSKFETFKSYCEESLGVITKKKLATMQAIKSSKDEKNPELVKKENNQDRRIILT